MLDLVCVFVQVLLFVWTPAPSVQKCPAIKLLDILSSNVGQRSIMEPLRQVCFRICDMFVAFLKYLLALGLKLHGWMGGRPLVQPILWNEDEDVEDNFRYREAFKSQREAMGIMVYDQCKNKAHDQKRRPVTEKEDAGADAEIPCRRMIYHSGTKTVG